MNMNLSFAIFDTAIGPCGVAWTARGLYAVQLPETSAAATRARLQKRYPDAQETEPPAAIGQIIEGIAALLGGEKRDLHDIVIDDGDTAEFNRRVYAVARAIPPGETLTYGPNASATSRWRAPSARRSAKIRARS
jgi:methylated-DNA-[protein]-cysteine S-methyltransferase